MKKTLKNILIERTKTIEYRAIRKQCMNVAQNGGNQVFKIRITTETILMLQNEMLAVDLINDGTEKYRISW